MEVSLDSGLEAAGLLWDKILGTSRDPRTVLRFPGARATFSCRRARLNGDIVEGAIVDIVKNGIIEATISYHGEERRRPVTPDISPIFNGNEEAIQR